MIKGMDQVTNDYDQHSWNSEDVVQQGSSKWHPYHDHLLTIFSRCTHPVVPDYLLSQCPGPRVGRLQMNRGYKKTNRNTDFCPMKFVSYSQIRIFKISTRICMKGIRILKNHIPFIFIRIQKKWFGKKGIYSDIK